MKLIAGRKIWLMNFKQGRSLEFIKATMLYFVIISLILVLSPPEYYCPNQ